MVNGEVPHRMKHGVFVYTHQHQPNSTFLFGQKPDYLHTIHARHGEIKKDDIEAGIIDKWEEIRFSDEISREPFGLRGSGNQFTNHGFIIEYENR